MRRFPRLRARHWILAGALALGAAVLAAPYLSADAFGGRIRVALERALHRKVEIQAARFTLLRGPGFSLLGVVIHDDPASGAEPFAYVNSIDARVSLLGLLRGKMEFSSLRLAGPSVNLVKTEAGPWNFQALLGASPQAGFPAVSMRDGRLNFTVNGVKSVFYFSQADVDLNPPRTAGGAFTLGFSGNPTRSDRTARGFGTIRGRGRWRPSDQPGGILDLEVALERTSLGELATLVLGHDIGIHGQLAGRATFRGPVDGLTLDGTLELTDLHRWDLLPPYAEGGPLRVRGRLDLPAQAAEIETVPDARSAIGLRLRAWDYLAQPRWVVGATLHGFPIAPLAEVGRHMGLALGAGERPEGVVSGAVAYSPDSGLQGALLADGFSLSAPERLPLKAESVRLLFDGDRTTMPPAVVTIGEEDRATLRFDYSLGRHQLDLRLDTGGMGLAMLSPSSGPVPGLSRPDFAGAFRSGQWSGRLAFHGEGDSPGAWSGTLQLRDAVAALDGLSDPVRIAAANVSIQKDGGVRASGIEAASGGLEFRGEYVFQPGASRPERIAGRVARARLSDVDRLLGPTLHRPRGLLSRTLRLDRGALPDWLAARRLHGSLEIGELEIAGETIESLQLDFYWDGASIDVPRYSARALGGELDGYLSLDLRAADPSLRVAGRLETPRWRGGSLVGEGVLAASGSAETIRRNLRAEGQFRLHNASLGPGAPIPQLAGDWNLFWEKGVPRLRLDALRLTEGDEVFTGQGGAIALDRLEAGLALGDRRVRLSGALRPLSLSRSEGR